MYVLALQQALIIKTLVSSWQWFTKQFLTKFLLTRKSYFLWNFNTTKIWHYTIFTLIGPHRQYYVRMARKNVLVQNHCFLRRHVSGFIPPGQMRYETPQPVWIQKEVIEEPQPIQIQYKEPQPVQMESTHHSKPALRLLEDSSWPKFYNTVNWILIVCDHSFY